MSIVNTAEYDLCFITFVFLKCSQKNKKLIKLAFLKRNHRKEHSFFFSQLAMAAQFLENAFQAVGEILKHGRSGVGWTVGARRTGSGTHPPVGAGGNFFYYSNRLGMSSRKKTMTGRAVSSRPGFPPACRAFPGCRPADR